MDGRSTDSRLAAISQQLPSVGFGPPPGVISHKPSKPSCWNRRRHKITVLRLSSNSRAMALSDCPEAAANTMRLRGQTC